MWTSVGVVAGVGIVALTGWKQLDPIVALALAANIISTDVGIVRRSVGGLMDTALPVEDRVAVWQALKSHEQAGVKFHALWTRHAGARKFISLHVLVPGVGLCSADINSLNVSKMIFAKRCWTRRSSHILNHRMIRPHGTTKPLIDGSMRLGQRTSGGAA